MTRKELEKVVKILSREYDTDEKTVLNYFYKLAESGIHLIEWPTGTGKSMLISILALLFSLSSNLKCFIFCRTFTQIDEYLKRLNEIANTLNIRPKLSVLLGKEITCPYGDVYNKEASYLFCNYLGNGSRCRDFKKTFRSDLVLLSNKISSAKSIEEAVEYLIENGVCPYYSLRQIAESSDICISSYYYLFRGSISGMREPLKYCIFIDEGHNLIDHFISSNIVSFERENLHHIMNKLGLIDELYILSEIEKKTGRYIEEHVKNTVIHLFKKLKEKVINYYYNQFRKDLVPLTRLFNQSEIEVVNKLLAIDLNRVLYVDVEDENFKLYMLQKFSVIKNIINSSYSTILASATLSPQKFFERFFKSLGITKEIRKYDKPYLYDFEISANLNIFVSNDVTSRYVDRTLDSFYFVSDFAVKTTLRTGLSTILFVPSYETGEILYSMIQDLVAFQTNNNLHVIMGEDIEDINSFIKQDYPGILILSQRGRYSEGINNFRTSDKPYNIIMYGFSIQPNDPLKDRIISKLFELNPKETHLYGYILPAVIFFVQSIGRVLNKKRKINIFILEKRALRYLRADIVPKWFRNLIENHELFSIGS